MRLHTNAWSAFYLFDTCSKMLVTVARAFSATISARVVTAIIVQGGAACDRVRVALASPPREAPYR
jgi:hypothetical protein